MGACCEPQAVLPNGRHVDGIVLRARAPVDEEFLFHLYSSTRTEEMDATGWSPPVRHAFLTMQYQAQDRHYRAHYPDARFDVVERGGQPVGRLYVARGATDLVVLDIALLAEHRGFGIGTTLLRSLQREAGEAGKAIVIHVERNNRARDLYARLGFVDVEDKGIYMMMRWPQDDNVVPSEPRRGIGAGKD